MLTEGAEEEKSFHDAKAAALKTVSEREIDRNEKLNIDIVIMTERATADAECQRLENAKIRSSLQRQNRGVETVARRNEKSQSC